MSEIDAVPEAAARANNLETQGRRDPTRELPPPRIAPVFGLCARCRAGSMLVGPVRHGFPTLVCDNIECRHTVITLTARAQTDA
jgi:hypothetical protein